MLVFLGIGAVALAIWLAVRLGFVTTVTVDRSEDRRVERDEVESPEEVIGSLKWVITEGNGTKVLGQGEKSVSRKDVTSEFIDSFGVPGARKLEEVQVPLSEHFMFGLADSTSDGPSGFGLFTGRNDERTFCWEWFSVARKDRATKLQETGELKVRFDDVGGSTKIGRTEFLTDVSFRVMRMSELRPDQPRQPTWRVKILKGSWMEWPT